MLKNSRLLLLGSVVLLTSCGGRIVRYEPMIEPPKSAAKPQSAPSQLPLVNVAPTTREAIIQHIAKRNKKLPVPEREWLADRILYHAESYSIPPRLMAAIISVESSFNAKATSKTGAKGLGQLIPSTAKWLGVDDPYDAEQNLKGVADFIGRLLKTWQENDRQLEHAIASYYIGTGNIRNWNKEGKPWPDDVQGYVRLVHETAQKL